MPAVHEKEVLVDENNNINVTITNEENTKLPIFANSVIAIVVVKYRFNSIDNFTSEILEINKIFAQMTTSLKSLENQKGSGKCLLDRTSDCEDEIREQQLTNFKLYEPFAMYNMRTPNSVEQDFYKMLNLLGQIQNFKVKDWHSFNLKQNFLEKLRNTVLENSFFSKYQSVKRKPLFETENKIKMFKIIENFLIWKTLLKNMQGKKRKPVEMSRILVRQISSQTIFILFRKDDSVIYSIFKEISK